MSLTPMALDVGLSTKRIEGTTSDSKIGISRRFLSFWNLSLIQKASAFGLSAFIRKREKQRKSSRNYSSTYFADVLKILKVSFSEIILWRIQTFQPDNFLPPWGNVLSHEKYISHCEKRKKLNHNYYRLGEAIVHKIKDFL